MLRAADPGGVGYNPLVTRARTRWWALAASAALLAGAGWLRTGSVALLIVTWVAVLATGALT